MTIDGKYDASDIIRTFLREEYAFSIRYLDHEIRIAHNKGVWCCGKFRKGKNLGMIEIMDCSSGCFSSDDFLASVYRAIEEEVDAKPQGDDLSRDTDAFKIEKFLRIWGGKTENIDQIVVIQPGRNAWLKEDGDYNLAPRNEEWSK